METRLMLAWLIGYLGGLLIAIPLIILTVNWLIKRRIRIEMKKYPLLLPPEERGK